MRIHDDWATPGFDLEPVAPRTGPFPGRALLENWWVHRRPDGATLELAEADGGLLPMQRVGDRVEFLGEADLFDYHSPLGAQVPPLVADYVAAQPGGTHLLLDSLPREAADLVAKGLEHAGVAAEPAQHEIAAIVDLPGDFESYLGGLHKKQKHEVERKRRRFERELGPARLETHTTQDGLDHFVRMHRQAPGPKGEFMTEPIVRFFAGLLDVDGFEVDLLTAGSLDGHPVAGAVGFATDGGYYLYNSAFDPGFGSASPGQVLLSELLSRAIDRGATRFDFLKGDEEYKFRLGARERPLYALEARL